jgi:hypothetical protein
MSRAIHAEINDASVVDLYIDLLRRATDTLKFDTAALSSLRS